MVIVDFEFKTSAEDVSDASAKEDWRLKTGVIVKGADLLCKAKKIMKSYSIYQISPVKGNAVKK